MSLIIDIQYVARLGPFLQKFRHTGGYNWACRCPLCGDSKKRKNLTRGGFFRGKDKTSDMILYGCFNCSASTTLASIIEHCSPELLKEYRFAAFKEANPDFNESGNPDEDDKEQNLDLFKTIHVKVESKIELGVDDALDTIKRVDLLPDTHPAKQYVINRDIPEHLWNLFYFAPKFKRFTNSLITKFDEASLAKTDYPRLIIPFFNEHGRMFAFAARAFGDEQPKYFTIKIDENEEKIYGRERLDYRQHIYVVEGQIDSMLLPNCISVSGSSFDMPFIQGIATNCTLVPDNEPRNAQIVQQYRKYIQAGYRVCMLPETFKFKDINEAIQGGMSVEAILKIIDDNSFTGLFAQMRFASWQKTDISNPSKRAPKLEPQIMLKYFGK